MEDFSEDVSADAESAITMSIASEDGTLTRTSSNATTLEDSRGLSPVKTLTNVTDSVSKINLAEKEKILMECKNQIKVCGEVQ